MGTQISVSKKQNIRNKIYMIRVMQVILDRDLAELYQVETRTLNQAVKRNIERFPIGFMFQLTQQELNDWMSQIVISNKEKMGIRKKPYAFTEQGVAMLSVLKSKIAVITSIQIIQAFVQMRKFIVDNALILQRINFLEKQQFITTTKLEQIFKAIEDKNIKPQTGIFFDGQVFDAYTFACNLICSAKKSLILIDNYVDESVLTLLSKRSNGVSATIYTKSISKQLTLDIKKHNEQYPVIEVKSLDNTHDRFLIIDEKDLYHIGASLKDLGKKWFAFSRFELGAVDMLKKLEKSNNTTT